LKKKLLRVNDDSGEKDKCGEIKNSEFSRVGLRKTEIWSDKSKQEAQPTKTKRPKREKIGKLYVGIRSVLRESVAADKKITLLIRPR